MQSLEKSMTANNFVTKKIIPIQNLVVNFSLEKKKKERAQNYF